MSIELEELNTEKERLEGDRKILLERLQELQAQTVSTQQQIQAVGGAIQTCNYFIDTSASTSKKLTVDNLFGAIPVNIAVTDTTDSSSNTTGSITTTGGVGISKNLYVGEDVFIFGNTTIGGASSDTVAIPADVASDIIPDGDGTRDLGDGSNQFSNLFVNNITTTAFTANSTSILIAGTDKLFFQDTGTNIQSPTDGTLDIAADTILEVTAPTTNVIWWKHYSWCRWCRT